MKRKRITRWRVYVGDRVYEDSKTEERRDEIIEILKGFYPGVDIRYEKYCYYITV